MNKTVVITGGSSGIGLACVQKFLNSGYKVFELSRKGCNIKGVYHIKCDVTSEADVSSAFNEILLNTDNIDLLICNAGYGISGPVETTSLKDAKRQFDVNFYGAFLLAKACIPSLRKSQGRVLFISSAAGVFPIPFQAFYASSKAAINSFACALRNEVKPFNISVCVLMPGDVKTGFTKAREPAKDIDNLYGKKMYKSISTMENDEKNGMSSEYVANKIYKFACKKHVSPTYTIGLKYKLFCLANKFLPTSFVNYLINIIY